MNRAVGEFAMCANPRITILVLAICGLSGGSFAASLTRSSSFEFDPTTGLLTKSIVEGNDSQLCVVTTYGYDSYGNRTKTTIRNCNGSTGNEAPAPTGTAVFSPRVSVSLFSNGQFPTTNTDSLGHNESDTYDSMFGDLMSRTDANGHVIQWTYDAFGRPTLQTNPDGTEVQWTYNFCGGVNGGTATCPALAAYVVETQPLNSGGAAIGPWTKVYFDILNRQIRQETLGYDGSSIIVESVNYDTLGHTASKSRPYYSGATPALTTFAYDNLDRVISRTNPDGSSASTSYSGLTVATTNELLQTRSTVHNSQGQTTAVTDAAGQAMTFRYDPEGDLVSTIDPAGNVVSATYDLKGRKIQSSDPDMGTWNYIYDALGQLVQQTTARGKVVTYAYDAGGRPISRMEPDLTSNWNYDICSNGVGKLCSQASSSGFNQSYTYDSLSRPQVTTTTIDHVYSASISYDSYGRISSQTYPTGVKINYSYTALGYLQKIVDASTGTTYWQANSMDAEGHLTQVADGNGVVTNSTYSGLTGRLSTIMAGPGGGSAVEYLSYTYDALGNVQSRIDNDQSLTESFIYDALNRVTSGTVNSPGAGNHTISYQYDSIGNLTSRSDVGTYTYGPANSRPHAVSQITLSGVGTSFVYDADGNMTAGNGRVVSYTDFDMPSSISAGGAGDTFMYGPDHQRIERTTNSTIIVYLNPGNAGKLYYEKEMNLSHSVLEERLYISVGGTPVVMLKRLNGGGSYIPYYLHRDGLGSTVAITGSTGSVVERLSYEPFGKRRFPTGASDPTNSVYGVISDRCFTNHEHLDDLDLIDMNGRVYDPLIARFLTADPNVQFADDIQSYNRYSYVQNNPLNATDPSGYFSFRSLLGDLSEAANQYYKWNQSIDPVHKWATQYLASHQWAYTLATVVAAAATAECGGCGAAAVNADVTTAETGSVGRGIRAGAITYAENSAANQLGGGDNHTAAPMAGTLKGFETTVQHGYVEAEMRQLFARIARHDGMSPVELDAYLEATSFLGKAFLGDRLIQSGTHGVPNNMIGIAGILSRNKYFPGASLPFDIADVALSMQGLPTSTSFDYGQDYAGERIYKSHSLGAIDAANIVAWGGTFQAKIYALPFPMTAPLVAPTISLTNSLGDVVPGMFLSVLSNPVARLISLPMFHHDFLEYTIADPPVN